MFTQTFNQTAQTARKQLHCLKCHNNGLLKMNTNGKYRHTKRYHCKLAHSV